MDTFSEIFDLRSLFARQCGCGARREVPRPISQDKAYRDLGEGIDLDDALIADAINSKTPAKSRTEEATDSVPNSDSTHTSTQPTKVTTKRPSYYYRVTVEPPDEIPESGSVFFPVHVRQGGPSTSGLYSCDHALISCSARFCAHPDDAGSSPAPQVCNQVGSEWTVERRYSHFEQLRSVLERLKVAPVVAFPPKQPAPGYDKAALCVRAELLSAWATEALRSAEALEVEETVQFFCLDGHRQFFQ